MSLCPTAAAHIARRLLRKEVNALDILWRAGCTNSIPELLGVFQRTGSAQELASAWAGLGCGVAVLAGGRGLGCWLPWEILISQTC